MPWVYEQSTGKLFRPNGQFFYVGWAGQLEHRNDPSSQCVANRGPIPAGLWNMVTAFNTGPSGNARGQNPYPVPNPLPNNYYWSFKDKGYIIKLMPQPSTNVCGRDGFLIHGGSSPEASEGCIIINGVNTRKVIWNSGDHVLNVVVSLEQVQ